MHKKYLHSFENSNNYTNSNNYRFRITTFISSFLVKTDYHYDYKNTAIVMVQHNSGIVQHNMRTN